MEPSASLTCPICNHASALFDVVDFNKNCEEQRGRFLGLSGYPVYYARCSACHFCYAPEICSWSPQQFEDRIYNASYRDIDPEYEEIRPHTQAKTLTGLFGAQAGSIRHLDYGGGNGLLSSLLRQAGFDSTSYDPFVDRNLDIGDLGKFDLISAIEVFEHVPDVHALMGNLGRLLKPDGILYFTTLLSDGNIVDHQRLTWWYASPRNGHISLFSMASLGTLARRYGFVHGTFNVAMHLFWRTAPPWAAHLIKANNG